jgi:hypothetical protein
MMNSEKLNRIMKILHDLREESAAIGPTNSLAAGKIAGTVEAGDNPPVDLRKKNVKRWNPFFKQMAKLQRRESAK